MLQQALSLQCPCFLYYPFVCCCGLSFIIFLRLILFSPSIFTPSHVPLFYFLDFIRPFCILEFIALSFVVFIVMIWRKINFVVWPATEFERDRRNTGELDCSCAGRTAKLTRNKSLLAAHCRLTSFVSNGVRLSVEFRPLKGLLSINEAMHGRIWGNGGMILTGYMRTRRNMSQCHYFDNHKSRMYWPERESVPPRLKTGSSCLWRGTARWFRIFHHMSIRFLLSSSWKVPVYRKCCFEVTSSTKLN